MYNVKLCFVGLGVHEGVNEEFLKAVPDYQAALEFLQGLSAFDADRKIANVSIELEDN